MKQITKKERKGVLQYSLIRERAEVEAESKDVGKGKPVVYFQLHLAMDTPSDCMAQGNFATGLKQDD